MTNLKLFFPFFFIGMVLFTSCETDFDVNASYRQIPIVFGLLDQRDSVHYIKITRTFLGDGNNYEFAQVADSSYFNSVDGKIIELNENGVETGREWTLRDSIISGKEDGIFYNPEQKVYVFYEADLDPSMTYKLEADINEGYCQIDAETELIGESEWPSVQSSSNPVYANNYKITFDYVASTDSYKNLVTTFEIGENTTLYYLKLIFNYQETYLDGTTADFAIEWSKDEVSVAGETDISAYFSGEEFFQFLQSNIDVDDNVSKRTFIGINLVASMASEELERYMEVSQPSTSISQSTIQYSNINCTLEDGALGLFSSRSINYAFNYYLYYNGDDPTMIQLSDNSLEELKTGTYTYLLNFQD